MALLIARMMGTFQKLLACVEAIERKNDQDWLLVQGETQYNLRCE